MTLSIEELRYSLRPENLEGTPREFRLGSRDRGRLLVVHRKDGRFEESHVQDLPSLLSRGDVVVLNNSARIPGVLRGRTERDGLVELRFVDLADDGFGLCKIFPMHDVQPGSHITLASGRRIHVLDVGLTQYALCRVAGVGHEIRTLLKSEGEPILGFFYDGKWSSDCLNPYYASEEGSVESPLAGLHFTPSLVGRLEDAGIRIAFVTLHSVGSWLPFLENNIEDHEMWAEWFSVSAETADAVSEARANGNRVIACGSTSLRALESAAREDGEIAAVQGRTSLYITPGYRFRSVDGYFTNFHQYQTSLIVLDAAFAGKELVLQSYEFASQRQFSFYEFGDAVMYV